MKNFNIRMRRQEIVGEDKSPDDIILEDMSGNIVAYLMREWNVRGYYIIPQFKTINDINKYVGTYYEGFSLVNKEFSLVMGLD